ncbi:LPS assembly lipoprotein LptE [Aliiglaciecola litoralis]|uniref:LPS-assembly lipoprotein LptE n=1 Tax=Aliiglaciecola litoralis TaxID=582857 RepID=A0ABN1LLF3_9ALTE
MIKLPVRALIIVALVLVGVSACGFKLREAQALPNGIEQIFLTGVEQNSPLRREVRKYLKVYQIPYVTQTPQTKQEQTVAIYLMPETLDRRLLSLFPTGQVAEYELVLTIRFQVAFAGQEARFVEFDVTREYQDDPDAILAKSRELDLVLSELRQLAADRMIRMLPSLDSRAL